MVCQPVSTFAVRENLTVIMNLVQRLAQCAVSQCGVEVQQAGAAALASAAQAKAGTVGTAVAAVIAAYEVLLSLRLLTVQRCV